MRDAMLLLRRGVGRNERQALEVQHQPQPKQEVTALHLQLLARAVEQMMTVAMLVAAAAVAVARRTMASRSALAQIGQEWGQGQRAAPVRVTLGGSTISEHNRRPRRPAVVMYSAL